MDLVVCEKPSAAKDHAAALGAKWNEQIKAYEGPNHRIVLLVGHVLRLKGLRESDERFQGRWDRSVFSHLPVFPDLTKKTMYVESEREIVSTLKKHFNDPKITRVINACDPGREGELLFWEVYHYCGAKQTVFRFWESQSLEKHVVLEGYKHLKDASFYEPRKRAAYARQHADWLVGMNLSVAYTAGTGVSYSVGPVQTPVLAMIVQRDELIELWQPIPYCEISVGFEGFKAKYKPEHPKFEDRPYSLSEEDAQTALQYFSKAATGTVSSIARTSVDVLPPKLYSLTTLQIQANKKYGYTLAKTLEIAQKLYEEYKCLSYPRTDSEVIGTSMGDQVRDIAKRLGDHYGITYQDIVFTKRNMNDAELTDHHALIPLKPIPEGASESEKHIYNLVLTRFFQAFGPKGVDQKVKVTIDVAANTFEATGRVQADLGWRQIGGLSYEEDDGQEKEEITPALFNLKERQILRIKEPPTLIRKTIDPPGRYTDATLLKDMEFVANTIEDKETRSAVKALKGRLATPATQSNIIELLIKRGYVERKKKQLISTQLGRSLIHTVSPELKNPSKRAEMELYLQNFDDPDAIDAYLRDIRELVKKNVEYCASFDTQTVQLPTVGVACPNCQSDIVEKAKVYACKSCDLSLPKVWGEHKITQKDIQDLVTTGKTGIHTFRSKDKSSTFAARLQLVEGKLSYDFPEKEELSLGSCPKCSEGKVYPKNTKVLACTGCDYVLFRTIAGVTLTDAQVKKLLKHKSIPSIKGFRKKESGETFSAGLVLNKDGKVEFRKAT